MSIIIKKVRFAIDEAKEEMVREAETGGMWAATKRDDEPSAHESLQAILTTQQPDEHAGASTWGMSLFGKLPSASNLPTLFGKSQISSIKDWLRSFTAAGRAERIEQDWEEAVRRAYATHAFNDHMNELQVSRCRHNHGTSRTVSITLDSYQTVEQETSMPVDATTPASTAGSIWSNERVVYPQQPTERPASEINTPIVPQLKPTSRWPDGLHKYQAILSDPSFADVNYWASIRKPSRSELDSNTVPDEFNEITTSYSDGIKDYLPMKKSLSCIDKVDQCMKGSGEYVLFGRWRHHKDAPLSFVKDMIEKDLRGPGSNSLWGPGGLDIADHPLVCYYNERLRKLSQDESSNTDILEKAQLSPVLLNGRTSSQRSLLRSATPVTFNMTKDGVFQTTGFQQRTSSMGSTVESLSPQNTENIATNAQTDARRDSGVHGLQSNASPQAKHKNAQPATSVQYEVLRPYSPDPAVNMRLMNDASYKPEARKCEAWVSESYQKEFCGGVVVPEASQAPAGGDRHAARANTSRQRTQQPIKTQEEYDERERQAAYCLQKRGYEQQNQHAQAAGRERGPQPISRVQQQHIRAPAQRVASKQGKRVRSQTPGPQHRKVTLVPPEEAENAMWSDDEEADNVEELPKFNKLRQSEFGSPSPRGMLNKASLDNTSGTTTEKTERPVLATKRASAAESDSSSAASATVKDHAGLDTSADLSPCHTTPGTTASSGRGRKVKSPARAESLARRLADLDQNKGDDLDVPETRDEIEVQQQIIDN